jgi:large subunit ribosomal protein L25
MATKAIQMQADPRAQLGSRANAKLRESGFIPGVVYGHKEAVVPVKLPKKSLSLHLAHGAHVFDLSVEGKSETVLVKEVQYDHLGTEVLHVDFARVSLNEKVTVTVPLELKGDAKGEAEGGVLQQLVADLEVECVVTDIPDAIRYNVSELGLDAVLHLKDIQLPPGVVALQDEDLVLATLSKIEEEATEPAAGDVAEPEVIGKVDEAAAPAEEK